MTISRQYLQSNLTPEDHVLSHMTPVPVGRDVTLAMQIDTPRRSTYLTRDGAREGYKPHFTMLS